MTDAECAKRSVKYMKSELARMKFHIKTKSAIPYLSIETLKSELNNCMEILNDIMKNV